MRTASELAAGLRALADVLDANPHLVLPTLAIPSMHSAISVCVGNRDDMAAWVDVIDNAHPSADRTVGASTSIYALEGTVGGLPIRVFGQAKALGGRETSRTVRAYDVPSFAKAGRAS